MMFIELENGRRTRKRLAIYFRASISFMSFWRKFLFFVVISNTITCDVFLWLNYTTATVDIMFVVLTSTQKTTYPKHILVCVLSTFHINLSCANSTVFIC